MLGQYNHDDVYCHKHLGFKVGKFYKDVLNRLLLCSVVLGIIIYALSRVMFGSWSKLIIKIILYCIIYAILLLLYGMNKTEKSIIFGKFVKNKTKGGKQMKKIGILTFHYSINNGAVTQAYSLSKRLTELYPDVKIEIIDYWMQNRTRIFEEAMPKLPLSEYTIIEDFTKNLFKKINEGYDVLIVGSDAVWNYVTRGFLNAYFPAQSVTCKKLSYSASCYGMDFTNIDDTVRSQICQTLATFSFIGVRDRATEAFVEWSGCKKKTVNTCDLTAFLDVEQLLIEEELIKEKMKKRGFDFSRPTIGIMGNEKMYRMVRKMFGTKYQIVALYEYIHGADVNMYDFNPNEWDYVFRYFNLTFTTYFHGTMLSLRNGVPLICVALNTSFAKKHIPKTLDVLQRLGFFDWYFETDYYEKNVDKIHEKASTLINSHMKEEIISKINQEAENFKAFQKELDSILCKLNSGGVGISNLIIRLLALLENGIDYSHYTSYISEEVRCIA